MFLPSKNGFHFSNSDWPDVPILEIPLPLFGNLKLGNAGAGLCGGMSYHAADYWAAKKPIPPDTENPAPGSLLYNAIVSRFMDSVNIPWGVVKALALTFETDPIMTDVKPIVTDLALYGVCPITLILVQSYNPIMSDHNHQVLVYALDGSHLRIYDNNEPDNDDLYVDYATMKDNYGNDIRALYRNKWIPKPVG